MKRCSALLHDMLRRAALRPSPAFCAAAAPVTALLLPAVARACAVCGGGTAQNRAAFFWTTVLLSLLPLGMMAGGFLFLRRTGGAWTRDEFADRED